MSDTVLEARNLTCTFMISAGAFRGRRPLHAVNGVDLTVARGEVLALVGESGCGKTTLAKIFLGLQEPSGGTVRLNGQPLSALARLDRARFVQPIFQDPYSSLNPRKTIRQIMEAPLRLLHGMNRAACCCRIQCRPADQYRLRTQRDRLNDVAAASDSAVKKQRCRFVSVPGNLAEHAY